MIEMDVRNADMSQEAVDDLKEMDPADVADLGFTRILRMEWKQGQKCTFRSTT